MATVLEWLARGMTPKDRLRDYPDLEREDLQTAPLYAARLTEFKRVELFSR